MDKNKLEMIIELLDEALDLIHEINETDETERLYCTVRDVIEGFRDME